MALRDSSLLTALSGTRPERLPMWLMRQAGRSLPEYRELRARTTILDACLTPEIAAEITLQPVRRHRVDAGIFFSDIMVPLRLAGVDLEIVSGVGPVIAKPVRTPADVDRLVSYEMADPAPIAEAVRLVVQELGDTPLIGFAGAPFTLAAYLVEGRGSRDQLLARAFMHSQPQAWNRLLDWCARLSGDFLTVQVDAGVSAIQLFDSWAGVLSRQDYLGCVASHSAHALAVVGDRVPRIHFGTRSGHLLADMAACGAEAVGVDHRTPLDEAARAVPGLVLQGNIDPAMLLVDWPTLESHAREVVERGRVAPAHIVNLGHGVPPSTDPGIITELVALIHEL